MQITILQERSTWQLFTSLILKRNHILIRKLGSTLARCILAFPVVPPTGNMKERMVQ
jgi:hypothetical protein